MPRKNNTCNLLNKNISVAIIYFLANDAISKMITSKHQFKLGLDSIGDTHKIIVDIVTT